MILYYKIGIKIVIKIFLFISKCIRFGITIKINTIETRGIYYIFFKVPKECLGGGGGE